jgi:DNA-binding LacI/PurR family transcriptional regulator
MHPCVDMSPFRRLSLIEQTAAHLREGLIAGRWRGQLPGVVRLAEDLAVSKLTLRGALRIVEAEGLVELGTDGRSRHVPDKASAQKRPLRIGILLFDSLTNETSQSLEIFLEVYHELEAAGFTVFFSKETQCGLGQDVKRITRYVKRARADAWVVASGSRALLEWFAVQPLPAMALFGRQAGLPIAGAKLDKRPPLLQVTRQLIALGHRRIVHICRRIQRVPEPSPNALAVLAELEAHGCLGQGDYNLPDWEETPGGLHTLLTELFRTTPPTALIIDETPLVIAAQQFLAERKLRVPEHVSLVAKDRDSCYQFCYPPMAHIAWRTEPVVRRIVQWANSVSLHRTDVRQIIFPAEFIPGGTVGPVWPG